MFNGENLLGWHVSENPDSVFVQAGKLVTHGPRAHAFYVGTDGATNLVNFHFKAKVMTMANANSGIYFHTRFQQKGWPSTGMECQVNNTYNKDKRKTASLYGVQDRLRSPVHDNVWFDYEIIVKDKRVTIKINGTTVNEYEQPENLKKKAKRLGSGTFAIQAHDPDSKVYYKDLMFRELK